MSVKVSIVFVSTAINWSGDSIDEVKQRFTGKARNNIRKIVIICDMVLG